MDDYSYLYDNILEAEVFLRWFKQYVMDMETPTKLKALGGQPVYYVKLPTHNKPIPIAHWKIEELPINRQLKLDIISHVQELFRVWLTPQGARVRVQVYGLYASHSDWAEAHIDLRDRLLWDFPATEEIRKIWAVEAEARNEAQRKATEEPEETLHIYENTVELNPFMNWLKGFLFDLVEPRPAALEGTPISLWLPTHNKPILIQDLADTEIPTTRPFDIKLMIGRKVFFSAYFEPQGALMHVRFHGEDYDLIKFYEVMSKRLEYAFPHTETVGESQQKKHSTKSRTNKEKERVQASLIKWACEIQKIVPQFRACEVVGINERTYRRYRKDELCFTTEQITEMGTTFKELWDIVIEGGDIEAIIEFD